MYSLSARANNLGWYSLACAKSFRTVQAVCIFFPALLFAAFLTTANIPPYYPFNYWKSVIHIIWILYVYSLCLSRFLIFDFCFLRHIISIIVKTYKPAQIANAYFELVYAREKPDGTIEEIRKFLECEHQVKQIIRKGWTNLPRHAIKHDGWTDAVEASLKNGWRKGWQWTAWCTPGSSWQKGARVAPPSVYRSVKHVFLPLTLWSACSVGQRLC